MNASGILQVDHGKIARTFAVIPQAFNGFVRNGVFHGLFGLDFMNAAHGAFEDVVLFFQPREKAGNIPAHIVDGHFAAVVDLLIFHQLPPDLFGGHLAQGRVHGLQQPLHGNAVILDGALRAALDFLGIKEQLQIFLVGDLLFLRFGFGKRLQQHLLQLFHLRNIR